jgi:hypothetical protein
MEENRRASRFAGRLLGGIFKARQSRRGAPLRQPLQRSWSERRIVRTPSNTFGFRAQLQGLGPWMALKASRKTIKLRLLGAGKPADAAHSNLTG